MFAFGGNVQQSVQRPDIRINPGIERQRQRGGRIAHIGQCSDEIRRDCPSGNHADHRHDVGIGNAVEIRLIEQRRRVDNQVGDREMIGQKLVYQTLRQIRTPRKSLGDGTPLTETQIVPI